MGGGGGEGVLLEKSSWMRMGELLKELGIEDGDPPPRKICNSQSRDQNYVWCNFKQTIKSALSKKVAIFN